MFQQTFICFLIIGANGMILFHKEIDTENNTSDVTGSSLREAFTTSFDEEMLSLLNDNVLLKEIIHEQNGSDSGMYNEDFFEGDILLEDLEGKNAVSSVSKLWPKGVVVFKISDDVGCPDSKQCKIIMYAMELYHKKTCIRFKEWTGEKDFVEIFYNKANSGACWSSVGKAGGKQKLSLGQRCWFLGIAAHELGHAAGFWHEMNRPDRDRYIRVLWQNIIPGFTSAFIKNSPLSVNTLGEPFDFRSIMMYDEYAFSKDGRSPTIETKSGVFIGPIWRKRELSTSDIRRVHKLYKCEGSKPHKDFPYDFNCDFSANTCGFRNRERTLWKWRAVPKDRGYIFAAGNHTTSNIQLISSNFHSLEETHTSSQGCFSFTYYQSEASDIQVKQEVLYSATDTGFGSTRVLWNSTGPVEGWNNIETTIDLGRPYRDYWNECQSTGPLDEWWITDASVRIGEQGKEKGTVIVFDPIFNGNGIVAINKVKITVGGCSN